ncbi:MAG: ABC transporter permease [Pseudoxanthomonas sp.]|nr:ABC transporter permease [Pseudoxanthomonas sp.]
MIWREVIGRYKGSFMGLFWSLVTPLLMLLVYTFFFSVVFQSRWPEATGSKTAFAIILFSGLMIFNFFAECVSRAPTIVIGNTNYVKKIIFPLELLPIVVMGAAAFHLLVSFIVWLGFYLYFMGLPSPSVLYIIPILVPLVLWICGLMWIVSSLGVYLRDVNQFVATVIPAMMLLSPVFYPATTLPEEIRPLFNVNPLTFIIEQTRAVLVFGHGLDWATWSRQLLGSFLFAWIGLTWFQKTRKGFADVL